MIQVAKSTCNDMLPAHVSSSKRLEELQTCQHVKKKKKTNADAKLHRIIAQQQFQP